MPAYLSRSAISSARVPEQVTCRTRPASTSKSASQIHEMSRPSAMLSLRAIHRSSVAVLQRQRAQHLVRAGGVLDQQDRQLPAVDRDRLDAAECAGEALQRLAERGERHAELEDRRRRGHGVVDVVEAGQRERSGELALGRAKLNARSVHALQLARSVAATCGVGALAAAVRAAVAAEVAQVDRLVLVGVPAVAAVLRVGRMLHAGQRLRVVLDAEVGHAARARGRGPPRAGRRRSARSAPGRRARPRARAQRSASSSSSP